MPVDPRFNKSLLLLLAGFLTTSYGCSKRSGESVAASHEATASSAVSTTVDAVSPPTPGNVPNTPAIPAPSSKVATPANDVTGGTDFAAEARVLFRIAACASAGEVPARFDRRAIDAHCITQRAVYERYEKRWLALATPFFSSIRPKVLPHRVVYPFGGGDLVTALTVFPDADEFTTISMEAPGDVRLVDSVTNTALHPALSLIGRNVRKLLGFSYSNTVNLGSGERAALPGEIALHFAGLVVHGYEPVGLRYFAFELDGSLHYLTSEEITTREGGTAAGGASPFSNVEIRFARPDAPGTVKILRHIEQDLSNHGLGLTPGLRRYLDARGDVAAMTKAASHLLWSDDFGVIRTYLQEHIVWMASDSTGLPPRFAEASGLSQTPYGIFEGPAPFGPIEAMDARAFRHLFESKPHRALGFRFGYGDKRKRAHLIVTERGAAAARAPEPTPAK